MTAKFNRRIYRGNVRSTQSFENTLPLRAPGFSLVELMIVIAIIGILASVAVPQYGTYVKRSRFTEIVNAASEAQSSIATCLQVHYGLDACDTWGELQLDKARFELRELIQSAELQSNPFVFTLTAIPGLNSATYTISVTANESGDTVSWDFGGTCKSSWNYC